LAAACASAIGPAWCRGADHVIHISVDGLRPSDLQSMIAAGGAPNFKRFQDEGVWTNNARTDYTHTITLPNHTSMITGRPVSQPSGFPAMTEHGFTNNDDPPPTRTIHNFTNPDYYKASTFDVVHDAGFSTAMYASKSKFNLYNQSYNAAAGAPHLNGSDKIDVYFGSSNTAAMQNQLLSGLTANHFDYTFVHYADPDEAGHNSGWGSTAYIAAIKTVDGYLGEVFNLVQNDATLAGQAAIILSADHGGTGTGHGTETNSLNYTVPFYVWGAGVGHGDLYALNTGSRLNPGTSRPSYSAAIQPIRNGDGGNLALKLLGLGPIPGSVINAAQNLRVTMPGDFSANNEVDAADYVEWRKGLGTTYSQADYQVVRSHFGQSLSAALAGDFDQNGVVDGVDYAVWRKGLGTTYSQADYHTWRSQVGQSPSTLLAGDFDRNGVVDSADYVVWRNGLGTTYSQTDYDIWRSQFGQTSGSAAGAASGAAVTVPSQIPEPTTQLILVLGGGLGSLARRSSPRLCRGLNS